MATNERCSSHTHKDMIMQFRQIAGTLVVVDEFNNAHEVSKEYDTDRGTVVSFDGEEYQLYTCRDEASADVRDRWADMAAHDPGEFACIVGTDTLVSWALNQWAGPGSTQVRNLEEWLDLVASVPEEDLAGYDGEEHEVTVSDLAAESLGLNPTTGDSYAVAYRNN